jgi:stress-induced morphogen
MNGDSATFPSPFKALRRLADPALARAQFPCNYLPGRIDNESVNVTHHLLNKGVKTMIEPRFIEEKIKAAVPDAEVHVHDLTGTMDHYEVIVISDAFEGKPLIRRHRMIYDALVEEMKGPIHALTIKAWTHAQAKNQ